MIVAIGVEEIVSESTLHHWPAITTVQTIITFITNAVAIDLWSHFRYIVDIKLE